MTRDERRSLEERSGQIWACISSLNMNLLGKDVIITCAILQRCDLLV